MFIRRGANTFGNIVYVFSAVLADLNTFSLEEALLFELKTS